MNKLTDEVFQYIKSQLTLGISPSIREICENVNAKSTSTIHKCVKELEEAGFITRMNNSRRTILINSTPRADVPILGTVAAGVPIPAVEDITGYIPYTNFKGDPSDYYALTIKGDSMIKIGMFEGDIVIIRRVQTATNNQLVVALVDDEATVKRFFKEDGKFRLQPENDNLQPMYFDEVEIIGLVVASFRNYE